MTAGESQRGPTSDAETTLRQRAAGHGSGVRPWVYGIAPAVAVLVLIGLVLSVSNWDTLAAHFQEALRQVPTWLFLLLMLLLPVAGFPLSAFLVLAGTKFGPVYGLILLAAILPPQLALMYAIGRKPARNLVKRLLTKAGYRLPDPPEQRRLWYASTVAFFPGLAYALKNYALAVAGIPLTLYMAVSWPAHFLMGIPFVVTGGALRMLNPWWIGGAVIAFAAAYLLVRVFRGRSG